MKTWLSVRAARLRASLVAIWHKIDAISDTAQGRLWGALFVLVLILLFLIGASL